MYMRLNQLYDTLRVMKFFENNRDGGFSISDISKRLKINYQKTMRILKVLYELGYVDFFHHENKKIYYYVGGLRYEKKKED